MTKKRIRVVVLFGGRSGEHHVSAVSARHVLQAMDSAKYEAIPIGITIDGRWMLPEMSRRVLSGEPLQLPSSALTAEGEAVTVLADPSRREIVSADPMSQMDTMQVDVVFPVLHGPYGEDGTVQGLLEMADIPYVGAGVLGSALSVDKEKMKKVFVAEGLPVGEFTVLRRHLWDADRAKVTELASRVGFPCFVKPANLGSSVGITKVKSPEGLVAAIEHAFLYDRKVLVEEAIPGREIECGVLGNDEPEASLPGEILPGREFYDYEAKYTDDSSRTIVPAELPELISAEVREISIRAFLAVEASGMARVDFFYDEAGRGLVLNEINTIPGFTPISMYPKMWEASGIEYSKLIDRLIELALERHSSKPRPEDQPKPPEIEQ